MKHRVSFLIAFDSKTILNTLKNSFQLIYYRQLYLHVKWPVELLHCRNHLSCNVVIFPLHPPPVDVEPGPLQPRAGGDALAARLEDDHAGVLIDLIAGEHGRGDGLQ